MITSLFLTLDLLLETPGKIQRRSLPKFMYGNNVVANPTIGLVWGTTCVPTNTNHGLLLRQEVKKYVAPPGVFKTPIPCLAPSMLQYGVATVPG